MILDIISQFGLPERSKNAISCNAGVPGYYSWLTRLVDVYLLLWTVECIVLIMMNSLIYNPKCSAVEKHVVFIYLYSFVVSVG